MPRPDSCLHARIALAGVLFSLALGTVHAVPASPEAAELKQPDGTRIRLVKRGDEFFSWDETAEGYAVAKNGKDGFWEFARPATDRAEFSAVSGARVGSSDPAKLGLRRGVRPEDSLLKAKIRAQRLRLQGNGQTVPSTITRAATNSGLGISVGGTVTEGVGAQTLSGPSASGTRTVRNIVILASFADHWDAANHTVLAVQGRTNTAEYSDLFNTAGYHLNDAAGSVRDYYREVSYGQFTVESIVVGWVKLPNNEAYYGNNDTGDNAAMAADAINAADAAGFDFSQGDADGDGKVDCLTIIHSGHGEEWSGAPASYIWSHMGPLGDLVTKDGVTMNTYCTVPALWGIAADTDIITDIGVTCHEMGHIFGLPDLYDYSSVTSGLGNWSLMAYGSWNGSYANSPAHLDAWSKWTLGFLTPTVVLTQPGISLASVEDHPEVALVRDGCSNGEYFLVENRARVGFDNTSAIHPGLLIYHVNINQPNNTFSWGEHPLVKIEEADGNNSLGLNNWRNRSEPGDVWTSTNGLPGGFRDQTGNATSNAMLYQSGDGRGYERVDAPASYTWIRMGNFSAASALATFDVATLRTGVRSQSVTSRDFIISWPACSTSGGYKVKEGTRVVFPSFADSAEEPDFTYDNWTMSGLAQCDDRSARTGSYCYALLSPPNGSFSIMTKREPFMVQSGMTISYYIASHMSANLGTLQCQISTDNGATWKVLQNDSGPSGDWTGDWAQRTVNAAQLADVGIGVGARCILRFVASFIGRINAWGTPFPLTGFVIDDLEISNTPTAGYGNWTTVTAITPATTQAITGKANGVYAYQVRSYANGIWQPYGPVGEVTVACTAYTDWAAAFGLIGAAGEMVGNPSGDGVANLLKFAFNLNPNTADTRTLVAGTGTAGLPVIGTTTSGGTTYLTVEYLRRKDAPELGYGVQVSSDLATWAPLAGTPTVTVIDAVWERVRVVDSVASARRFARVRVTWTPAP